MVHKGKRMEVDKGGAEKDLESGGQAGTSGLKLISEVADRGGRFYVVHDLANSELKNPSFGGARLVAEQIRDLKDRGYEVEAIQGYLLPGLWRHYFRIQLTALMKTHKWRERTKREHVLGGRAMGAGNVLRLLFNDFVSRIDYLLFGSRGSFIEGGNGPAVVIYNYPFAIRKVSRFLKNRRETILVLYEHNLEWKFHAEIMGKGVVSKILTWLTKKVEFDCIKEADYVFCLSEHDREGLIGEGIRPEKVRVWLPMPAMPGSPEGAKERMFPGKIVVGYVGSNFKPNVNAVRIIMSLASELGEHFIFLVVGPVDKAFVGKKIPDNVVFTGRVPNLQEQLSSCDAFINPKEGLDTGAEMKMYDYLGYGKPIFASEEGARGFEGRPEIIICQIKEMAGKIVNLRVNTEKAD